jgi:GSH-dependent disulfide-bond oxidoreductase
MSSAEIQYYGGPTPNCWKVGIALEEMGLPYKAHPINIKTGEQFGEKFLKISPNNKIPAIVDGEQAIFESGAILMYLAEKVGLLLSCWPSVCCCSA